MNQGESGRRCQNNFRRLLEALSRPGRVVRLEPLPGAVSFAAALAIGECLLDHEVTFGVADDRGGRGLEAALCAVTGARCLPLPEADFVFATGVHGPGALSRIKRGTAEAPDTGATVVYCLEADSGAGPAEAAQHLSIRLSGPGIAEREGIAPQMKGLPSTMLHEIMALNADYPLGVDFFFISPEGDVMGLPRSTRIRIG